MSFQSLRLDTPAARHAWRESVHTLLAAAYRDVPGGLHYASAEAMVEETQDWELLIQADQVRAALPYKRKHCRKIVALAASADPALRQPSNAWLGDRIRRRLHEAWIEVSGRAETFVLRHGGDLLRIPNDRAARLTGKPVLALHADGFHYDREIQGLRKCKLIVGAPRTGGDAHTIDRLHAPVPLAPESPPRHHPRHPLQPGAYRQPPHAGR